MLSCYAVWLAVICCLVRFTLIGSESATCFPNGADPIGQLVLSGMSALHAAQDVFFDDVRVVSCGNYNAYCLGDYCGFYIEPRNYRSHGYAPSSDMLTTTHDYTAVSSEKRCCSQDGDCCGDVSFTECGFLPGQDCPMDHMYYCNCTYVTLGNRHDVERSVGDNWYGIAGQIDTTVFPVGSTLDSQPQRYVSSVGNVYSLSLVESMTSDRYYSLTDDVFLNGDGPIFSPANFNHSNNLMAWNVLAEWNVLPGYDYFPSNLLYSINMTVGFTNATIDVTFVAFNCSTSRIYYSVVQAGFIGIVAYDQYGNVTHYDYFFSAIGIHGKHLDYAGYEVCVEGNLLVCVTINCPILNDDPNTIGLEETSSRALQIKWKCYDAFFALAAYWIGYRRLTAVAPVVRD